MVRAHVLAFVRGTFGGVAALVANYSSLREIETSLTVLLLGAGGPSIFQFMNSGTC